MKLEIYPNDWIDTRHLVSMRMCVAGTVKFYDDCSVMINLELLYGTKHVQRQVAVKEIQDGNRMFRKMLKAWKSHR